MQIVLYLVFIFVIVTNIGFLESWGTQRSCLVSHWSSWNWFSNGTGTRSRVILRYPSADQQPCPHLVETQKGSCEVSQWTGWHQSSSSQQLERTRNITSRTTPSFPCPSLKETLNTAHILSESTKEAGDRFATPFLNSKPVYSSAQNNLFAYSKVAFSLNSGGPIVSRTGEVRDLLIIIDSSGSVSEPAYTTLKSELGKLLALLCPQPDPFNRAEPSYQQVALVTFSSDVREVFDFDAFSSVSAIRNKINTAPYLGRMTCTGDAFEYGKSMFTIGKGARVGKAGVKQEVLIITDGLSNCGKNARAAARSLKETTGAEVFGLLVDNKSTKGLAEVADYVSSPELDHLFLLEGIIEFKDFVKAVEKRLREDESLFCAPFE